MAKISTSTSYIAPTQPTDLVPKSYVDAGGGGGSGGPIGSILPWPAATIPDGYLLCDGSAISRTTYSDLFTAIGTVYGVGDGSTTFNLPDFRGRFILGRAVSGTGSTLGGTGGAIDHTHSLPAHHHAMGAGADLNITSSGTHTTAIDHDHGSIASGAMNSSASHSHSYSDPGHNHSILSRPSDGTVTGSYYVDAKQTTQALQTTAVEFSTTGISINSANIDHTHNVDLPNFVGSSASNGAHTHPSGNFSGRIGLVTGGVDGNAAMTSGTSNPPFQVTNFIIKFTNNVFDASGGITFTPTTYTIRANTVDGTDNKTLALAGGGAGNDPARGAYLMLYGNEVVGNEGNVILKCGNVSGANLYLSTFGAQPISFVTNNALRWSISSAGNIMPASDNTGNIGLTSVSVAAPVRVSSITTRSLAAYCDLNAGTGLTVGDVNSGGATPTFSQIDIYKGGSSFAGTFLSTGITQANLGVINAVNCANGLVISSQNGANTIYFATSGLSRWSINSSGHIIPAANTTYNIGSSSNNLASVYSANFLRSDGNFCVVGSSAATGGVYLYSNNALRWVVENSTGHFSPASHNTFDIGNGSTYVRTIYAINHNAAYVGLGRPNAGAANTSGVHLGVDGTTYSYFRLNDADIDADIWVNRNLNITNSDGSGGLTTIFGGNDTGLRIYAYSFRPRVLFNSGGTDVGVIFVDNGGFATGSNNSVAIRAGTALTNGVHLASGATTWSTHSDERDKKNIISITNSLSKIVDLNPVTFDYTTDETDDSTRIGFIAQEVKEIIPEIVDGSDETKYSMRTSELIPFLVDAIKELKAENDALKARVETLEEA